MQAYEKTFWSDNEGEPINAENLNHIESGIEAVTNEAINTDREIAAARGSYTDLKERLDHTGAPTDEQVAEAVEDYFDEHPISGAEKFVEVTDTSDTAVDNCTDPDTVYIVRVVSGVVTTTKMRVICTPNVAGQMAQYAMTKDGYIITRKYDGSEWSTWDFIPNSSRVAAMISAAIAGKADSSAIPTKTSQLNNDSGFLTQHQDISGKENTSNKKTSIGNQSQTGDSDTFYPTVGAVRDFVNFVKDDLEDYVDEEIGNMGTAKQDKLTAGENITIENGIISAKGDGTSPLADKNIVVFGDSLTDPQSGGISWTESFINIAEYNSFRGYGRGYCTWTFKNNTEYNITDNTDANVGSNVIWNQFNKLKHDVDNNNTPIPDIIMIFCADNDILQSKTIGSESATFKAEAQSSDVKTLTNMVDSIRYNIDTINAEYPNCIIVPIIPLLPSQYAKSKTYRDALITCYNNLGLSYIDVMYGSGIAWYREVMKKTYFAGDGVHLSGAGSMKVAKFIYQSLITMPRIQKLPSTTTNKGLYNVYYNFTNATSTNSFASVMQGEPYRAIISATTGYSLTSVTCTMGGISQPVEAGVINIASVTGNITITAVGGSPTPTTYTITNNLTNATSTNAATSILAGEAYIATISPLEHYTLDSLTCTMGGVAQTITNNTIDIASVSGNIVVTAVASSDQPTTTYTVTNNLTNATNSNAATSVEEGASYTATISANQGYHMSSVTCTMGGVEQTVTDNTISIANVTGNIVITATATQFVPVEGAYIHNDGDCWIGTSYVPSKSTTKVELVAEVHNFTTVSYAYLVGSTSTKISQWAGNSVSFIAGGAQPGRNQTTISFDKKFTAVGDITNRVFTITDVDGTRSTGIVMGSQFDSKPMWYFAGYWDKSFEHKSGDMKIYSMKIWEGDTLVYEGYPVSDSNGAGMYDVITGTTNYNEGTGTLTYGVDSAS